MLYKRDLTAFDNRVKELFEWKNKDSKDYMAPYFPLIQSSGTGKTKLMHEYKNMTNNTDAHVHVELILCQDGAGPGTSGASEGSIFSNTLDVSKFDAGESGQTGLCQWLDMFVPKEEKKVVLLFDESQHLMNKHDAWHFRCIRWWLRLPNRPEGVNVVSVFAGTTTRLANYYTEPKQSTSSRDAIMEYLGGDKLYPPFYQITTTGIVSRTDGTKFGRAGEHCEDWNRVVTEFDVAAQYGRPLLARLHLKGELMPALGSILLRIRGGESELSLRKSYSLLATRLQMGQVSFDVASELVASGYAHLTHFSPENNAVAEIAFLPDPVCAWLAMTQMIGDCRLFGTSNGVPANCSNPASFWSEKAIKIYSSALCRPGKGDVGEVAAAFYMLACADALRWKLKQDLTQLSVPLEEWIARLQSKGDTKSVISVREPARAQVNFIQVCRDYLRHSVDEIQRSGLLRHWYLAGRASYVYASCVAYDILVPIQYNWDGALHYCPMLVSVKNRVKYSENQRSAAIDAMKNVLGESKITTGVCVLLLIGLEDTSPDEPSTLHFQVGEISTVVIVVPEEDDFGATKLALCSTCGGGEESEVMASHADLALGAKGARLLRTSTKVRDPSKELLEKLSSGYSEAFAGTSDERMT
mmetsp:Transcript_4328/g.10137  ORF Transcript_4328/g.10137 Transcript_4328/m.10137 type:complete len:640 (-) Transcript_4328:240-2159(-)